MRVYFVGAGPGDPDLLTRKAARLLQQSPVCIYAGSLVSPQVLELIPEHVEKHDSAGMDLDQMIRVCIEAVQDKKAVVRLHTGDPCLYGAINEQMEALDRHGIDYEVVPGVSAFQASAAALRRELTAPEIVQTVILSRTEGRTPMPENEELDRLAATRGTLCLFLSVHKIREISDRLSKYYGDTCPAAVVFHASWPDQQVLTGTLSDIADKVSDAGITKTALILAGWSLTDGGTRSKLYDADFAHGYRRAGSL